MLSVDTATTDLKTRNLSFRSSNSRDVTRHLTLENREIDSGVGVFKIKVCSRRGNVNKGFPEA